MLVSPPGAGTERHMKYWIMAAILAASSTHAMAADACQYGKGGIFEFISWSFKMTDQKDMEVSVKFRNKLGLDIALDWK